MTPTPSVIRGFSNYELKRKLNLVPRTIYASAIVNTTPTKEISSLVITSTTNWSNIKPGQMVMIGSSPGAMDIAVGMVRQGSSPSSLNLDARSQGDPRFPLGSRGTMNPIISGSYISILNYYPPYPAQSRIAQSGNSTVFYKNYDRVYVDEMENLPPKIDLGPWVSDDTVTVASRLFTATPSLLYQGKIARSYLWSFEGLTILEGSVSSQSIRLSGPPGYYVIQCLFTDSGGATHQGRTYWWINGPGFEPFSDLYPVTLASAGSDRVGTDMPMVIFGEEHRQSIFPLQGALYTEQAYAGNSRLDGVNETFVGYLANFDTVDTRQQKQRTYHIISPMKLAATLPNVQQQLNETPNPQRWTDSIRVDALITIDYLLRYHAPSIWDQHPIKINGEPQNLRKKTMVLSNEGLGSQLKLLQQLASLNIGSSYAGTLTISINPLYKSLAFRNAMLTAWQFIDSDYTAPISLSTNQSPTLGYVTVYAFAYDGNTILAIGARAPGGTQGVADNKVTIPSLIIEFDDAQRALMAYAGHEFALQNRPIKSVRLTLIGNFDFVNPEDLGSWYLIDLTDLNPPGSSVTRLLPTKVTRTWRQRNNQLVKTLVAEFEPEAFGQPGIPYDPERGGAWSYVGPGGWTVDDPTFYDPTYAQLNLPTPFASLIAWNHPSGVIARTRNALEITPSWEQYQGLKGRVQHAIWYETTTSILVATWNPDSQIARIYKISNPLSDTYTVSLLRDISITDPAFTGELTLYSSRSNPLIAGLVWHEPSNGLMIARSTGMDSFPGTGTNIGLPTSTAIKVSAAAITDTVFLEVNNTRYTLYFATDPTGTITEVLDSPTTSSSDHVTSIQPHSESLVFASIHQVDSEVADVTTEGDVSYMIPPTWRTFSMDLTDLTGTTYQYGTFKRITLPPAAQGKYAVIDNFVAHLEVRVQWSTFYADPPDYFPPNDGFLDINFFYEILFKDASGSTIYSIHGSFNSLTDILVIVYIPTPEAADSLSVHAGVDLDIDLSVELPKTHHIDLKIYAETPLNLGPKGAFERPGSPGAFLSFLEIQDPEPEIHYSAIAVDSQRLFRVDDPLTAVPTWTDITPTPDYTPDTLLALNTTPNVGELALVAVNPTSRRLFLSSNNGGAWNSKGLVPYTGVKRNSDVLVLWGQAALDISDDLLETKHPRLGDWLSKVGPVGEIKGVLIAYE